MDIEQLASELAHARAAESSAKQKRIEAEEAILAQYKLAETGSKTVKAPGVGLKLTLKTALSYKIDKGAVIPDSLLKKTVKIELNSKEYEALRDSDPMEFSRLSKMVTTTPRKPSVVVAVL
jgi:hypothetical protein